MHSKKFEAIKHWYKQGAWTKEMVYKAVPKLITAEEYEEITGEIYNTDKEV